MSKQKEELGKGIRALLRDMDSAPEAAKSASGGSLSGVNEIPLTAIEVNPFQPRADFDEGALSDLTSSIRIHGVIQPITVRRLPSGKYQLISGERRLRASRAAGRSHIPAYIRNANDQEMLEIALIENIQREDLNAMEIAINYQRLLDECTLKHEELAERVGKNRSTVTNYLRLLRLPPEVQHAIKDGDLSMGHARTLVALQDPVAQIALAKEIRSKSLSVRQAEKLAASYKPGKKSKKGNDKGNLDPQIRRWQDSMASSLSTRVQIKPSRGDRGEVIIQYHSLDDLHRLAELLGDS